MITMLYLWILLNQINRPLAMKKEGIQTRNRKLSMKAKRSNTKALIFNAVNISFGSSGACNIRCQNPPCSQSSLSHHSFSHSSLRKRSNHQTSPYTAPATVQFNQISVTPDHDFSKSNRFPLRLHNKSHRFKLCEELRG